MCAVVTGCAHSFGDHHTAQGAPQRVPSLTVGVGLDGGTQECVRKLILRGAGGAGRGEGETGRKKEGMVRSWFDKCVCGCARVCVCVCVCVYACV